MAKNSSFRCHTCGRTFAMAAHLGRHTKATHGVRSADGGHRAGRRAGTTSSPVVLDGRARLLRELQASCDELAAQRAALDAQVAALDQVIATLGGSTVRRARKRVKPTTSSPQPGSLRAHIEQVLRAHRGPLTVRDITAAVLRAGFRSRDKELPKSVGKYLAAMPNVVRLARGVFRGK